MGFRTGDAVVIKIADQYIKLSPCNSIQLERICLDEEKEDALRFLGGVVYNLVKQSSVEGDASRGSEIQELQRIVKQHDPDSALRFLSDVIYKRAVELMHAPGCKPVFELPRGKTAPTHELGHPTKR